MQPLDEPDPLGTLHGRIAFAFARALVDGEFEKAYHMLVPALRDDYPPSTLRSEYESMFSYAGETKANDVRALGTMETWPAKEDGDIGWAYVSISGPDAVHGGVWNEAVAVIVTRDEGRPLIRDITWGRP